MIPAPPLAHRRADAPIVGTGELADALVERSVAELDALASGLAPGLVLPPVVGGHVVGSDARADLVSTLGALHAAGVAEVAGRPVLDVAVDALATVEGWATDTFSSYRVAEALARFGPFDANELLATAPRAVRDELRAACDSSGWIELLDAGVLPRNYVAVLARCESARQALGLLDGGSNGGAEHRRLDDLVDRLADLLVVAAATPHDDSNHGTGRVDGYAVDLWLFTEVLAHRHPERLGRWWRRGSAAAVALVDAVASPGGAAVCWGRSSGVLAHALTIEVSALAGALPDLDDDLVARSDRRAAEAFARLGGAFRGGLSTAHQHRDQDPYRGPARRLQLTFDLLGKLAATAVALAGQPDRPIGSGTPLPRADGLVDLGEHAAGRAAVWIGDAPTAPALVPFVGGTTADYLPAPREPGLFEVPVGGDLVTWVPLVVVGGSRHAPAGVPRVLAVDPDGAVRAVYAGLPQVGHLDPDPTTPVLPAEVELRWCRDGRAVVGEGELRLGVAPRAASLAVPEVAGRPMAVVAEVAADDEPLRPCPTRTTDTDGIAEWRSFWNELPVVHEVALPSAARIRYRIRVTPRLRVASTAHGHHYDRCAYGPLAERVVELGAGIGALASSPADLAAVDVVHLHWPEWLFFDQEHAHADAIDDLAAAGVPVVWTVHNLVPHDRASARYDRIYQRWADAASVLVHHSEVGRRRFAARYAVPASTAQLVMPHGHFGDLHEAALPPGSRRDHEAALGLRSGVVRIGLVGAPRPEKDLDTFFAGLARCSRTDLEVVCWSLAPGDAAPSDPRVAIAEPYTMVDTPTYARRLAVCDVLALPFGDGGDLLTTGTAADALGMGLPALTSSWAYLTEHLGSAAIPMGDDPDTIATALDALTPEHLAAARDAAGRRRRATAWSAVAPVLAEALELAAAQRRHP